MRLASIFFFSISCPFKRTIVMSIDLLMVDAGVAFFDRSFDFSRYHARNTKPHTRSQYRISPPPQYSVWLMHTAMSQILKRILRYSVFIQSRSYRAPVYGRTTLCTACRGQTLTSENEGYTWTVNLQTAKKELNIKKQSPEFCLRN